MPVYEYVCEDCGCPFEELLPAGEDKNVDVTCPLCHSSHVRNKLSVLASKSEGGAIISSSPSWEGCDT